MGVKASNLFTQRVSDLMKRHYLTKKDMAQRLNIDYSTFWRKLNGKRNVDITLLKRIADVLGTSSAYLMGDTDNPLAVEIFQSEDIASIKDEKSTQGCQGIAYWGGVIDEAQRLVASKDLDKILMATPLLRTALNILLSVQGEVEKVTPDMEHAKKVPLTSDKPLIGKLSVSGGHGNKTGVIFEADVHKSATA